MATPSTATDMRPEIWSDLPVIVIAYIIDETTDESTLESWEIAAAGNSVLKRAILSKKFFRFSCSHNDLLELPNSVPVQGCKEESQVAQEKEWDQSSEMVKTHGVRTLVTPDAFGLVPANLVRDLTLDFTFPFLHKGHWKHAQTLAAHVPSVEQIVYNARSICPSLYRLESLFIDGYVPQELVNVVSFLSNKRLRSLSYRSCFHLPRNHAPPTIPDWMKNIHVRWDSIIELQYLTTLVIREIEQDDGESLGNAISCLSQLQHLELVSKRRWTTGIESMVEHPTEFNKILYELFPSKKNISRFPDCRLPQTLRSLKLIDNGESSNLGISDPYSKYTVPRYPFLEDVWLDLQDYESMESMLSRLDPPDLCRIALPGGKRVPMSWTDLPSSLNNEEYTAKSIHLIKSVESHLSEIRILNAWDTNRGLIHWMRDSCNNRFVATDLVLTGYNQAAYTKYLHVDECNTLRCNLFGYDVPGDRNRWGPFLERIRMDQIGLQKFSTSDSLTSDLPSVKILQLKPYKLPEESYTVVSVHSLENSREEQVASELARLFPTLRVISVKMQVYWIQHKEDNMDSLYIPSWKKERWLWGFREAFQTKEIRAIMDTVLTPEDWSFMRMKPCVRAESEYTRRFALNDLVSGEEYRSGTFVTLRRESN